MRVLVVNAGSSTLKLAVIGPDDTIEAEATLDAWDGDPDPSLLGEIIDRAGGIDAVGHRIVHGGDDVTRATLIDDEVESRIASLTELAPLHQGRGLAGIAAARRALPDVDHVACADTAFHATMPAAARTYALPAAWRQRWGLRRYGFHGLSHAWVARRAPEIAGWDGSEARLVSCHLGSGASLCAIRDGRSVATTMGFTPLDGLVMATRSGSVDPGLVLWLIDSGRLGVDEVTAGLQRHGGLAGLSGGSGDLRDVLAARDEGDERAMLAFDVYIERLRAGIAAMAAAMGGLDAAAFTGGVGEHLAPVRSATLDGLGFLDLGLDPAANQAVTGDAEISDPGAPISTLVITAREDLEIAHQVRRADEGPGRTL